LKPVSREHAFLVTIAQMVEFMRRKGEDALKLFLGHQPGADATEVAKASFTTALRMQRMIVLEAGLAVLWLRMAVIERTSIADRMFSPVSHFGGESEATTLEEIKMGQGKKRRVNQGRVIGGKNYWGRGEYRYGYQQFQQP